MIRCEEYERTRESFSSVTKIQSLYEHLQSHYQTLGNFVLNVHLTRSFLKQANLRPLQSSSITFKATPTASFFQPARTHLPLTKSSIPPSQTPNWTTWLENNLLYLHTHPHTFPQQSQKTEQKEWATTLERSPRKIPVSLVIAVIYPRIVKGKNVEPFVPLRSSRPFERNDAQVRGSLLFLLSIHQNTVHSIVCTRRKRWTSPILRYTLVQKSREWIVAHFWRNDSCIC